MISLKYQSCFEETELCEGEMYRSISSVGRISFSSIPEEVRINDIIVPVSQDKTVECSSMARISYKENNAWHQFALQPMYPSIVENKARSYRDFDDEKKRCAEIYADLTEMDWIHLGQLHPYDRQSLEIPDNSEILKKINDSYSAFQNICRRPKTHLKSINEIRPLDAVKRIGHEAIPYLASHNEDWEARTATGLRPARLFSRTEDDDFQIYENRVVKTAIDMILRFLRTLCKTMQEKKSQLRGVLMSQDMRMDQFGFDLSHQKCVNAMMGHDEESNEKYEEQSGQLTFVEESLHKTLLLLRRYRELKQSRLYRKLRRSKAIIGNLMPTNILRMDKYYHQVYEIWKPIQEQLHSIDSAKHIGDVGTEISGSELLSCYSEFIKTMIGFAAHSLDFSARELNVYFRESDKVRIQTINKEELLYVDIDQDADYKIEISGSLVSPIKKGQTEGCFYSDGDYIYWHQKVSEDEIEKFARKLKTRESRRAAQAEENRNYRNLRQAISAENNSKDPPHRRILVVPVVNALDDKSQVGFLDTMKSKAADLLEKHGTDMIVISMPQCEKNEQAILQYGYPNMGNIALLPISIADINSYRRFRLLLLRFIAEISDDYCPCCGKPNKDRNGNHICYEQGCGGLQVITTTCPNPTCPNPKRGKEYKYINYNVSDEKLFKMCEELENRDHSDDVTSFYRIDSLFHYKNIVPLNVSLARVSPKCPYCSPVQNGDSPSSRR